MAYSFNLIVALGGAVLLGSMQQHGAATEKQIAKTVDLQNALPSNAEVGSFNKKIQRVKHRFGNNESALLLATRPADEAILNMEVTAFPSEAQAQTFCEHLAKTTNPGGPLPKGSYTGHRINLEVWHLPAIGGEYSSLVGLLAWKGKNVVYVRLSNHPGGMLNGSPIPTRFQTGDLQMLENLLSDSLRRANAMTEVGVPKPTFRKLR